MTTRFDFYRWLRGAHYYFIKVLEVVVPLWLVGIEVLLNFVTIGVVFSVAVCALFLTGPLWMLLALIWGPCIIVVVLLMRNKAVRASLKSCVLSSIDYCMYRNTGRPRKVLWQWLYWHVQFYWPSYITTVNSGFALISNDGFSHHAAEQAMSDKEKENRF